MTILHHNLVKKNPLIDYRIGDGFYALSGDSDFRNKTFREYPNTILSEYLKRTTNNQDYNCLISIINGKNYNIPKHIPFNNNYTIVHLRIGDIMDSLPREVFNKKVYHDIDTVNTNLSRDHFFYITTKYIVPISWYSHLLPYFHNRNILIIAASHMLLHSYKNSLIYINEIKKILSQNGNNVQLLLGCNPDNDLLLIKGCNDFIRSSGNYSKLLSDLCKKFNKPVTCHPKIPEYWG